MPGIGVEHLVEEAADLLPPLLAELVQVRHGLMLIHEDEADDQRYSHGSSPRAVSMPGVDSSGKALDGDHLDELAADLGHHAAPQFLPADDGIQVHRIAGQLHRVMHARDAELQPAQEVVMRDFAARLR